MEADAAEFGFGDHLDRFVERGIGDLFSVDYAVLVLVGVRFRIEVVRTLTWICFKVEVIV